MAQYNEETKLWESVKIPYSLPMNSFLGAQILKSLKETPERVVQIFHEEGYEVTCDDLRVSSVRVAQNLTRLGIGADDVVGVICRNSSFLSFLVTGCVLIGAPINPLDLSFTTQDILHLFGQTKPKIVVCDLEVLEKVRGALRELKLDVKIFVTTEEKIEECSSISDLLISSGTEDSFVAPEFTQTADEKLLAIMCSSGTTGQPKGVKMTQTNVMILIPFSSSFMDKKSSRSLVFSPIYWVSAFYPYMLLAFNKSDIRIWSRNGFSCELFSEILEKHKVTEVTLVPIHLTAILLTDFAQTVNHKELNRILCVGAIASEWLRTKFAETFPDKEMIVGYGMTECPGAISAPGQFKENYSVGSLFPNLVAKVVDDNDENLGIGEVGEIRLRPQFKFMVSFEH